METGHHRKLLESIYGGRSWLIAIDVLAAATGIVGDLKALGATRCLCIAGSRGTGGHPDAEFCPDPIVLGVQAEDLMTAIRRSLDALANVPPEAVARVDAFDPDRRCRVLGTLFDDGRPVAGRKKYGARPASWQALEDKTAIDALWDAAGIARAPSRVVGADASALGEASRELDWGHGSVWSGDMREGFNGGATYVRWVRERADAERAFDFFRAHCDRVRVMPFIEGIPCSIHGIVFPDHTLVLRPCEMFVLRKPGTSELHYARAGTFWDPPAADREAMREVARRAGDHLRTSVGYRGVFTIDGVLGERGFLPTELNPRFGAAIGVMLAGFELPIYLLHLAVVEGEAVDFRPRELEELLLERVDRVRAGGGLAMSSKRHDETGQLKLVWQGDGFRVARDESEPHDALAIVGPGPVGSFLKVDLIAERTPIGPSAAPRVAQALAAADRHWQLELGSLEAAPDVRRG